MRTPVLVMVAVLAACSAPPPPMASPNARTWPARGESAPTVQLFTELGNGGVAAGPFTLELTLDAAFPRELVVKPAEPAFITRACENGLRHGTARWASVTDVQGDAATLSVVDGALHVKLSHAGVMSARVEGAITGSGCEYLGEVLRSVPTWHLVTVKVSGISGFEVTHLEQRSDCHDKVVVASGRALQLPTVTALDDDGAKFYPVNAPRAVALTLRGQGEVNVDEDERVRLSPGRTAIELDTTLPVRGLDGLYAVDAPSVTAAELELGLVRTLIKGSDWLPLVDGETYRLPFPERDNTVSVRANRIETTEGRLCSQAGDDWFVATSQTPETCSPTVPGDVDAYWPEVVKLTQAGECRATIGVRGTGLTRPTRFSVTY